MVTFFHDREEATGRVEYLGTVGAYSKFTNYRLVRPQETPVPTQSLSQRCEHPISENRTLSLRPLCLKL